MALKDSIISYWKLDESSGNAADSAGSNTLTNNNSMTYGAGIINNGAVTSPTGPKFLSIADASQTGLGITGSFSMSYWVKVATAPTSGNSIALVGKERNAAGEGIYVMYYTNTAGTLSLDYYIRDNSSVTIRQVTQTLTLGTWYHVVWTFVAGTFVNNLYLNGSNIDPGFVGGRNPTTNNDPFCIGAYVAGQTPADATFDEVGMWSRALTSTEATQLYNGGAGLQYSFGINFDVAGNSSDQAAASSYSGSASWNGTNRMLAIDVSMLGAGVTVTAMTYGGAACTFVGAKSTVTSFGRVECWYICSSDAGAPAAGANTLVVTLSGSLEFSVEWVSYTGVHQTSPIEAFNSNQATNAGSATDASVVVTPVSNSCWIHGAVVANDTSITANQTTRNNISGTLGSGGNEDNNAIVTPATATTMSYTNLGITTTWAIAGYAIRPIADAALVTSMMSNLPLLGVGI